MNPGDMRTIAKSPEGLEYWLAEEGRKEEEAKRKNSQKAKKEAEKAKDSRIQDEREYAQLVHQWHSTEAERGKFAFQKCLNLDRQAVDPASLPTYSLETSVCFSLWSTNMCQNWGLVNIHNGVLCLEFDHLATFQAGGQMCRGTINWNKRPLKIMMLPFPYPDVTYPPKSQEVFSLAYTDGAALGGIRDEHCTAYICIYDRERLRLTLHRELINPSGFASRWKNPHNFTTEWANIWGLRIEAGQVQSALSATPSIFRVQPSEPLENENSFPSGNTGLRNVKTEHFEEDQVYVGEEDQVLVKDEDQTLVDEENHISFHEVDHVPVGRGDKILVDEEDHISFHEENQVFIDEEREQGEEKKEEEEGYEEDSHEESYQKGYEEDYEEEDYEEDKDDPDAKETNSDYGNEPYDLDDMKSCLKEPPIQRLGVPGFPAASNVVSWGEHGVPVQFEVSIGKSLSDLQTSTVETMFLHFPDRQNPFEDTIKAMGAALNQGKFKNYGLSNYSTAEVQKVLGIWKQNGYTKPSVLAAGGLFSGHKASSGRWKSDNFIVYGDAIIFGISRVEQLYSTLDALKAGPLPEDLAAAITTFYSKVQGAELSYHL
ncbi:aflatoxin B1 aldehyde reductase member 2 [Colletotrichum paranaense]|uniref:Aflatoxin B1 aldehyde reductase member 2 n=1 Tax=Colletotrichum paranaense TaxID=1914294 RepID=A0ABQ9T7E9_9PEZI|nr:aflatoxin B1 aldehyde reductase member 2 [Colletotrichum paranaense]KAK1547712.1 aflatoxin B1 aldehyde reductase member 2 [Colletotrichum paranaense]